MNQTSDISSTIYAIGDVHGHSALLEKILNFIRTDSVKRKTDPVIYFIGDLVDRGPDSKGAMELVINALSEFEGSRLHLGNHDVWLLDAALGKLDEIDIMNWLSPNNGGMDTINSYGQGSYEQAIDSIRYDYPKHATMLGKAQLYSQHGKFVFVHAGIIRDLPMKLHDKETLTWIRRGFLDSKIDDRRLVIHGHTPIRSGIPEVYGNRINIDTAVFFTGRLTCLVLDPVKQKMEFFQANKNDDEVLPISPDFPDESESAKFVYDSPFSSNKVPEIDR